MNSPKKYIDWEPLNAVPGLRFRHFSGEADYQIRLDIFNATKEINGIDYVLTLEDFKNGAKWTKNYDIYQHLLYVEVEEKPVGYFGYSWDREPDGKVIYGPFGVLLQEYWGLGIASLMLRFAEDKCKEIAELKHAGMDRRYRIWRKKKAVETVQFLLDKGYTIERYFLGMNRPIDLPLGEHPLPPGLEIRPVEPAHYRSIWNADSDSFKDHWGYSEPTEEMYEAWQNDRMFQPHLWKIAWAGDQVVGVVQNMVDEEENRVYNRKRGYTENISVRRPWRGKGVASALIAESIRMFREMGMDHTHLSVDADSLTGALRLYQNIGYEVDDTQTSYNLCKPF